MKKITLFIAMCFVIMTTLTSCVTSAYGYNDTYYSDEDNVVIVGDTCYVYYSQPSTVFLNTLHIIDGAYFYWHVYRYIPVVFPHWDVWSPYRYFYYSKNTWMWRDRYHYDHSYYRRSHHWVDHRRPYHRPNFNQRPYRPQPRGNGNHFRVRPSNNGFNGGSHRPPMNPSMCSSTRITVNNGPHRGNHPFSGHMGGRR